MNQTTLLTLCFNLPKRLPFSGRTNANVAYVITNLWIRVIDDVPWLSVSWRAPWLILIGLFAGPSNISPNPCSHGPRGWPFPVR